MSVTDSIIPVWGREQFFSKYRMIQKMSKFQRTFIPKPNVMSANSANNHTKNTTQFQWN